MDRRRALQVFGTILVGGVAGCSSTSNSTPEETTPDSEVPGESNTDSEGSGESNTGAEQSTERSNATWPLRGRTGTNRTYAGSVDGLNGGISRDWAWVHEANDTDYVGVKAVSSAPVSDGSSLYTHSVVSSSETEITSLVALDPSSGDKQWETVITEQASVLPSSCIVEGNRVISALDKLRCFDAESGTQLWSNSFSSFMGQPVVDDGRLFIPLLPGDEASDFRLASLNIEDGSERWTVVVGQGYRPRRIAITDDFVYAPAVQNYQETGLVALNRADGSERWQTKDLGVYTTELDGSSPFGPPVVTDDTVYAAGSVEQSLGEGAGVLTAVNRSNGRERWRFVPEGAEIIETAVSDETVHQEGGVYGVPLVRDDTLYITGAVATDEENEDWRALLYALDRHDGRLKWRTPIPGATLYPVGANNTIYITSHNELRAYSMADGSEVLSLSLEYPVGWRNEVIIAQNRLYYPDYRGRIIALRTE